MEKTVSTAHDTAATRTTRTFNMRKLQAAACIVASAVVSIGLIYLAIRALT